MTVTRSLQFGPLQINILLTLTDTNLLHKWSAFWLQAESIWHVLMVRKICFRQLRLLCWKLWKFSVSVMQLLVSSCVHVVSTQWISEDGLSPAQPTYKGLLGSQNFTGQIQCILLSLSSHTGMLRSPLVLHGQITYFYKNLLFTKWLSKVTMVGHPFVSHWQISNIYLVKLLERTDSPNTLRMSSSE